jgi:hypothetical protein
MSVATDPHPFSLPLKERIRHGAKRGAVIGVYIFALLWLLSALTTSGSGRLLDAPVTGAMAVIGGFALAGIALLALGPHVQNLLGAIALGTACAIPMWLGIVAGIGHVTLSTLPFVIVVSMILGLIWGTMSWKRWHR